ncbi:unnamed protein product [Moneuplotes crassus]|uniref:Uncharacterized protein n=1 Tax=Euplotes crassus TaxID=5936 RepID=A0AAD1USB6_EUPCR|nr:unnamed protein product [Moneuplotes crassus]
MRLSLRVPPKYELFDAEDRGAGDDKENVNQVNSPQNYRSSPYINEVIDYPSTPLETLAQESIEIKENIETQYSNAKRCLLQVQNEGTEVSMSIFNDLENLKKENSDRVKHLEDLLAELEEITGGTSFIFEQLDSKVKRIQHLESYLLNMESQMRSKGDKMYAEICKKRKANAEIRLEMDQLSIEISKLKHKMDTNKSDIKKSQLNTNEVAHQITQKDDHIKTLSKEIFEISERLDEATQIIARLKKKNKKREKAINSMSSKADKLMKEYIETKEKAFHDKNCRILNQREINLTVGSRMVDLLLSKIYNRQMKVSLNSIKNFISFDKEFFEMTQRMIRMVERKNLDKLREYFETWKKKKLKNTEIKQLIQPLKKSMNNDRERECRDILQMDVLYSKAKSRSCNMLIGVKLASILTKRSQCNLQISFGKWKSSCERFRKQKLSLKNLLTQKNLKLLFYGFKSLSEACNLSKNHTVYCSITSRSLYLQSIFSSLVLATKEKKFANESLKLRAFHSLISYCKFQKSIRTNEKFLDRNISSSEPSTGWTNLQRDRLRCALNTLKAQIMHEKLEVKRNDQTTFKKEAQVNSLILKVNRERVSKVSDIVETAFRKRVMSYYQHWYCVTSERACRHKALTRILLISSKRTTQRAFHTWRTNLVLATRNNLNNSIEANDKDNIEMIDKCRKFVKGIDHDILSNKAKATFKILKFSKIRQKKMYQVYLNKWRMKIQRSQRVKNAFISLHLLNNKLYLKDAFMRYKNTIKEQRKSEVIEARLNFMISSIDNRQKSRVFQALSTHVVSMKGRKENLLRIVQNSSTKKVKIAFSLWKTVYLKSCQVKLQSERDVVSFCEKQLEDKKADYKYEIKKLDIGTSRLKDQLNLKGKHVLMNALERCIRANKASAFSTWKESTIKLNISVKTLLYLFKKKQSCLCQQALTSWKNHIELTKIELYCRRVDQNIKGRHSENNLDHIDLHSQTPIKSGEKYIKNLELQKAHFMKKSHSVVKLKKSQKSGSTVIASQRIIFDGLKFLSSSKRKGIRKLEQFWDKKTTEKALFLINSVSSIKHFVARRKYALTKTVRILYISSLKQAFSSWRGTILLKHSSLAFYSHKEHHKHTQNTHAHIHSLQTSLSATSQHSKTHLTLFKIFKSLHSACLHSKLQKSALKSLLHSKHTQILQQVFKAFHLNYTVAAAHSLKEQRIKDFIRSNSKRKVLQSFRTNLDRTKELAKMLTRVSKKEQNKEKAKALRLLDSFGVSRMASEYLQKGRAARSIVQWIRCFRKRKLAEHFGEIKEEGYQRFVRRKSLGRLLNRLPRTRLQASFATWKILVKSTHLENQVSLYGRKAIDNYNCNQDLHSIINFAYENAGFKENTGDIITEALKKGQSRVQMLTTRPIFLIKSRMNNDKQYLKILIFQKWKEWLHTKKAWKYHIQMCDARLKNHQTGQKRLYSAFQQWKTLFERKNQKLGKISYHNLQERSIQTSNLTQSTKMVNKRQDETIYELEHQNKILIGNTISGQKMALLTFQDKYSTVQKRLAKKHDNTRERVTKAFKTWARYTKSLKTAFKQEELKKNMELIVKLRLQIKEYDMSNQELIMENDELRTTSMEGIALAEVWKELSEKIKILCVDLQSKQAVVDSLQSQNSEMAVDLYQRENY